MMSYLTNQNYQFWHVSVICRIGSVVMVPTDRISAKCRIEWCALVEGVGALIRVWTVGCYRRLGIFIRIMILWHGWIFTPTWHWGSFVNASYVSRVFLVACNLKPKSHSCALPSPFSLSRSLTILLYHSLALFLTLSLSCSIALFVLSLHSSSTRLVSLFPSFVVAFFPFSTKSC